jgi:hypothetical protein
MHPTNHRTSCCWTKRHGVTEDSTLSISSSNSRFHDFSHHSAHSQLQYTVEQPSSCEILQESFSYISLFLRETCRCHNGTAHTPLVFLLMHSFLFCCCVEVTPLNELVDNKRSTLDDRKCACMNRRQCFACIIIEWNWLRNKDSRTWGRLISALALIPPSPSTHTHTHTHTHIHELSLSLRMYSLYRFNWTHRHGRVGSTHGGMSWHSWTPPGKFRESNMSKIRQQLFLQHFCISFSPSPCRPTPQPEQIPASLHFAEYLDLNHGEIITFGTN